MSFFSYRTESTACACWCEQIDTVKFYYIYFFRWLLFQEHKVNECVFAKWTDCRMYASRIINIKANGMYAQHALTSLGECCGE